MKAPHAELAMAEARLRVLRHASKTARTILARPARGVAGDVQPASRRPAAHSIDEPSTERRADMHAHTRWSSWPLKLLVALLALSATAVTAHAQSFQTIILDSPNGLDNGEGTGISRDGVVAGYGW